MLNLIHMQNWTFIPLALGSAGFAALVAIFGKIGIKGLDSTLATALRSVIMTGFLLVVAGLTGKFSGFGAVNGRAWLYIILSGVAGALSWLCYFLALKLGPTTPVAALDRLSVVFVIVLAALFLGERLTWYTAGGAALISLGAVLTVLK